ncbi:MAG TPA: uroporphyrinogen decarboxylase family protein, partial [Holophaga sp.]|nr:uroporphyrinogen decarboxylase family protein [Holophaga sp.]
MASPALAMTSTERVGRALRFQEPDRVPFVLPLTLHGAREAGIPIRDYLRNPRAMAEAQVRMRVRYGHDCFLGFTYSSAELEAFGGETVFFEDGPPNGGAPVIRRP